MSQKPFPQGLIGDSVLDMEPVLWRTKVERPESTQTSVHLLFVSEHFEDTLISQCAVLGATDLRPAFKNTPKEMNEMRSADACSILGHTDLNPATIYTHKHWDITDQVIRDQLLYLLCNLKSPALIILPWGLTD